MATVSVGTTWTLAASGPATYAVSFTDPVTTAYAHRPIHCRWTSAATGSPPAQSVTGAELLLVNRPQVISQPVTVTGAGNGLWLRGWLTGFTASVV